MKRRIAGLCAAVLPALLAGQSPLQGAPPNAAMSYRGFSPGVSYRDFAAHARAITRRGADPMVCNTSRRTAQLMECGVLIRDPSDSASFYLSAYVLEGKVGYVSFGDSGGPRLVERLKADLRAHFGPPQAARNGTWQWSRGTQLVRFNWRGRGTARWIYILLQDQTVMDGITRYVGRKPSR
jgi:hypothetical protein